MVKKLVSCLLVFIRVVFCRLEASASADARLGQARHGAHLLRQSPEAGGALFPRHAAVGVAGRAGQPSGPLYSAPAGEGRYIRLSD